MKKKLLVVLVLIGFSIIALLLSSKFGFKREREITVSLPVFSVSPIFTDLKNWKYWYSGLKDKDTLGWKYSPVTNKIGSYLKVGNDEYDIIGCTPISVSVKAQLSGTRCLYSITAQPDSLPNITHLKCVIGTSTLAWVKQKLSFGGDGPESMLKGIQHYLENTKEFYGYEIGLEEVTDSLVLTKEAKVKKGDLTTILGKMFIDLSDYARANHIEVNPDSCRMATFYGEKGDSIHLAAGIPVSKRIPVEDGIHLLEMPPKGKMLVGKYQGPYKNIQNLYSAMSKYAFDKKLMQIGAAYEKFLGRSQSASDSTNMRIELHLPVL